MSNGCRRGTTGPHGGASSGWRANASSATKSNARPATTSPRPHSLPNSQGRDHWAIENSLHWVLDMTFRDDERRIRTENAPSNFTTLNHMANNLFRKAPGKDSLRMGRHTAAGDDDYLVSLIAAQSPSPDSPVLDVDVCPGDEHTSKHGAAPACGRAARSPAARPLANLVAWRLRFRQRGDHAQGRGARTCLPIQAAPDRQRQTHDREARLRARMGVRRPRLRGEGERGSADGL